MVKVSKYLILVRGGDNVLHLAKRRNWISHREPTGAPSRASVHLYQPLCTPAGDFNAKADGAGITKDSRVECAMCLDLVRRGTA